MTTQRWRVIRGGHYRQPVRRTVAGVGSYRLETDERCGVTWVHFSELPPGCSLFDICMTLDEAIKRGFVPAPLKLTLVGRDEAAAR